MDLGRGGIEPGSQIAGGGGQVAAGLSEDGQHFFIDFINGFQHSASSFLNGQQDGKVAALVVQQHFHLDAALSQGRENHIGDLYLLFGQGLRNKLFGGGGAVGRNSPGPADTADCPAGAAGKTGPGGR